MCDGDGGDNDDGDGDEEDDDDVKHWENHLVFTTITLNAILWNFLAANLFIRFPYHGKQRVVLFRRTNGDPDAAVTANLVATVTDDHTPISHRLVQLVRMLNPDQDEVGIRREDLQSRKFTQMLNMWHKDSSRYICP